VGVADLDGDGHEDVFLAQNFFPTDLATPRYDAGRGLVLRGKGDGTLEPVPGQVSGILVYGDQRGAALADYDGTAGSISWCRRTARRPNCITTSGPGRGCACV